MPPVKGDSTTGKRPPSVLTGTGKPFEPLDGSIPSTPPPFVDLLRTLASTSIVWPHRLGRPVGNLTEAFDIHVDTYRAQVDGVGKVIGVIKRPCPFGVSEGPHTDTQWRVTITTHWVEPEGWKSISFELNKQLQGDYRAHSNTVRIALKARWEAVEGLRDPFIVPGSLDYEHPRAGPLVLPDFKIWRLGG